MFVQLFGGNDGINTVYPLTGSQRTAYEASRPTLKLPTTNAEMAPWVDGGFGSAASITIGANADDGATYALHPAMGALTQALQHAARSRCCPGVHYPFADHSHFRSEAIYWTADPLGSGTARAGSASYLDLAGGFAPHGRARGRSSATALNPMFTPTRRASSPSTGSQELRYPRGRRAAAEAGRRSGQLYGLDARSAAAPIPSW